MTTERIDGAEVLSRFLGWLAATGQSDISGWLLEHAEQEIDDGTFDDLLSAFHCEHCVNVVGSTVVVDKSDEDSGDKRVVGKVYSWNRQGDGTLVLWAESVER